MWSNYKIKTTFLLLIILGLVMMTGWVLLNESPKVYLFLLVPALIFTVFQLFQTIDKSNRAVAHFLTNIKYDDFASTYAEKSQLAPSVKELHHSFNIIGEKFRSIRTAKEEQFQYLQAIVEHVDTGLICFDEKGQTILYNKRLQELLRKSYFPDFKSIEGFDTQLHAILEEILPGEQRVVKLNISNEIIQLAIRKTSLNSQSGSMNLYAIQNINAELEVQEVQSYQKLISILTHEIMNSIAPVISLSESMHSTMTSSDELSEEDEQDIQQSLEAIQRRGQGLMEFTKNYRQLMKVPLPTLEAVDVIALIKDVVELMRVDLQGVALNLHHKKHQLIAQIDAVLMEQVLINLIKNASQALAAQANGKIDIHISQLANQALMLQIVDNGPGISDEAIDQIFVPFYTTKADGSGIGLSLSRQIIQSHKGSLSVQSKEGEGTAFTIRL